MQSCDWDKKKKRILQVEKRLFWNSNKEPAAQQRFAEIAEILKRLINFFRKNSILVENYTVTKSTNFYQATNPLADNETEY
jgi:hypothetical protein